MRYGVDLSLDNIEALSPISDSYIIPMNKALTSPFALICYTSEGRPGALEEALTLNKALKELGVQVFLFCWGNCRELRRGLEEKLEEISHKCSFLLVEIMSHGLQDHIIGEDGSREQLNNLLSSVNTRLQTFVPVVRNASVTEVSAVTWDRRGHLKAPKSGQCSSQISEFYSSY